MSQKKQWKQKQEQEQEEDEENEKEKNTVCVNLIGVISSAGACVWLCSAARGGKTCDICDYS